MLRRTFGVICTVAALVPCGRLAAQCAAPGAPSITLFSSLPTAKGQLYVLAWAPPAAFDTAGTYVVERSQDPAFASGVETFAVSATSASLKSDALGTFQHRVRAVASCGTVGPPSEPRPVQIVDGNPVVIFATQPPAHVRTAGDPPSSVTFEVRNIGGQPFAGYLSPIYSQGAFIDLGDSIVSLAAGETKTYTAAFYGAGTDTPGTLQAVLTIQYVSGAQPKAYPWALVNVTVAPKPSALAPRPLTPRANETAPPVFGTDFSSFKATATSADPPPVTVTITNPRPTAMALAAETGPDGWLTPLSGWNATPLAPGETRSFQVGAQRLYGATGGVYPRYAFLTVKTKDGQSARTQFQDLDDTSGGLCSTRTTLSASEPSLIVPAVVTSDRQSGGRRIAFISRLLVTNVGPDPVNADIYFTPDLGDEAVNGYDCAKVRRATVQIPGADVLSLTDPLSKLFGFEPTSNTSGTLEVRSERLGQLRADSVVDSPAPAGGVYGFQLPVVKRGTGAAAAGSLDHYLSGLVSNATYRSNLILAETSGKPATVLVTVYDETGATVLFRATKTVPAYAKVQTGLNDGDLFQGKTVPAASVTVAVLDGAGTVAALATVIDRVNQDASTFLSRPLATAAPNRAPAGRPRPLATEAFPWRYVVPTVVSGYDSKLGQGPERYPYESSVTVTNGTASPKQLQMTYVPAPQIGGGDPKQTSTITIGPRQTVSFGNVLREAFGYTADQNTTGTLLLDLDQRTVVISSRVYSKTNDGNFGDGVPVMPADTAASTSGADQRRLIADGFEHSVANGRGARTNLILTEISGKDASVEVRLFEKGKERSGAIGRKVVTLKPFEKLQLDGVFAQLGTGGKDRTNVLCEVAALPGSAGRVVALGTRVDNVTADPKILLLLPVAETPGSPSLGF